MITRSRNGILLILLMLFAGCTPAHEAGVVGDEPVAAGAALGEDEVLIRVNNDAIPPTSLTVWMVPEPGIRQILGSIGPSETQTFTFESSLVSEEYILVGETTAGQQVRSAPFLLTEDATVIEWNVSTGSVVFEDINSD